MDSEAYKKKFNTELFENVIPFWLNYSRDKVNGGIYNSLDRYGKIYSSDKSVWMQGRCAYMFSYIYNHLKKDGAYLETALSCLDFLKKHCIDENDKRMFFSVTEDGRPLRKRRYFFSETFYIIANAEYYKATGEIRYIEEARAYYRFINDIYCGKREDPYKITPKTYKNVRDLRSMSEPMILLNVAQTMRDCDGENAAEYTADAKARICDILDYHYKPELHCCLESVGRKGEVYSDVASCRVVNPGHDIECSWFLLDEALFGKDDVIKLKAIKIFDDAIKNGWDDKYGGIKYFIDYAGKPVEAYEHDMKLWWPHNEATIASLKLYRETRDKKYLDWFEKVVEYEFDRFSDPKYGEWYGYLRRDGLPTEPPCKGHMYKGPFHVLRMLAKCLEELQNM